MKYTNRHNLPQELVAAITKDRYTDESEKPSDFSVSTLISPVQQTILKRRYKDDHLVPDVTDLTWSFFGSIAHAQIEEAWHANLGSKIEERLYHKYNGVTISGKFDCYDNGEIKDWKFTKVYKITKNDFSDWEAQLNLYAYLCSVAGYPVHKLTIYAFLRDWTKGGPYKKDYPECEWVVINIPLWSKDKQREYLHSRVDDLVMADMLHDERLSEVFPCSDKEMWSDVRDYAVIRDGATRATKCFDNKTDAMVYLDEKNDESLKMVIRKTGRKRCFDHCPINHRCAQHQRLKEEEGIVDTIF